MSDLGSLSPLAVALPLTGAALAPLLARVWRHLPLIVSLVAMAGAGAVLLVLAPTVFGGRVLTHYLGNVGPAGGHVLGVTFAVDPFGLTFALVTVAIGALLLLSTLSELGGLGARELGGYACLFQLLLAALVGAALTGDLFNLFVWFEVAALASYGLTGFFLERPIALEASFKILVLTTIASFGLFIGIGLLYEGHGALNVGQLQGALAGHTGTADRVALGLLIAGFATKAGLVPFHGWLADAHTAAPGPVSALFSGLMVNLGLIGIGRLTLQVFPHAGVPSSGIVLVVGLVSALLGATMALLQDDLKRLLAYDTVSQLGIIAVGLGAGSTSALAGATYHLVNHAAFKSLLFLCAGAVVHATGVTKLSEMGGLLRRMPAVSLCFCLGVLAIAGIPPFNGYVSLSLIHSGLVDEHRVGILALMLVAQVITIAALGRAAWLGFLRPRREAFEQCEPLRPGMTVALFTLVAACLASGVLPSLMIRRVVLPATSALEHPVAYAAALLHGGGALPASQAEFEYTSVPELAAVAASVVVGAWLVWLLMRRKASRPARPLRLLAAAHNGSVNDYTSYAVAGAVLVTGVLLVLR